MIRLSIIIPFYNVEQYIAQCLDSVYKQDIPEEEYEVICVNDASPDNSLEIVKEYQKKHKNLILVEHEVNKKLGAARNTGRRAAKGKYLWNVDSDDMIAPNCLNEMLRICEKNELDVLIFGMRDYKDGALYDRMVFPWSDASTVYTGSSFWKTEGKQNQRWISQVWTQVYSKSFLDAYEIYSPEINMGEDVPYTYASIMLAHRLMACNKPYYIYRINPASLTGASNRLPKPEIVYEKCFVCSQKIDEVRRKLSSIDSELVLSVRDVELYTLMMYKSYISSYAKNEKNILLYLCRRNYLSNIFIYDVMSLREKVIYTLYILTGKVFKFGKK